MKLLPYLLFISWLVPLAATAQPTTLRGQITDERLQPLPNAFVSLLKEGVAVGFTTSSIDGHFALTAAAGNYLLEVRYTGYLTARQTVSLPASSPLNLRLVENVQELQAVAVNATRTYPVTQSVLRKEELQNLHIAQELPLLLQYEPSVVTASDAGAGVGYAHMRIRGTDAQRTNVSINGIPINDAESQGTFWVNMPDLANSVQQVQIQRGVGTSANGAGAFGASVQITTVTPADTASASLTAAVGSFGTQKQAGQFHTGRLSNNLAFYGRLSRIRSDGFIDGAFSKLNSYFFSGNWQHNTTQLTANVFSGDQQTFQAWYGVPEAELEAGNRSFNPVAGYDNETDNYRQDHYQLLLNHRLGRQLQLSTALHYTRGLGYYEQFQGFANPFAETDLSLYGLPYQTLGDTTITQSELIRRRWLDNHFFGGVWQLEWQSNQLNLQWGGAANRYNGQRYGEIIWAAFAAG